MNDFKHCYPLDSTRNRLLGYVEILQQCTFIDTCVGFLDKCCTDKWQTSQKTKDRWTKGWHNIKN